MPATACEIYNFFNLKNILFFSLLHKYSVVSTPNNTNNKSFLAPVSEEL